MDTSAILYLREFAAAAPALDLWSEFIAGNALLKGAVPACMIWALWCRPHHDQALRRDKLLTVLALAIFAIVIGRALSIMLPFNPRPVADPQFPAGTFYEGLNDKLNVWSSFPSDHAVLFFAMATAMFAVNRTLGVLLLLHAAFIISLPRVINGYHWPSDILGGAVVGIATAILLFKPLVALAGIIRRTFRIDNNAPWVTCFLFITTLEVSTMFVASRELVSFVATVFSGAG